MCLYKNIACHINSKSQLLGTGGMLEAGIIDGGREFVTKITSVLSQLL